MTHPQLCADLQLPYISPGKDMKKSIVVENKKINVHKTIDNHISILQQAIDQLKDIKKNIPKDNTLKIHTEQFSIWLDGDNKTIDTLVSKDLITLSEVDPDEEQSDSSGEEDDEDNEENNEEDTEKN